MIINGNGKTIDANKKGRIFHISVNGDLTLINVTLTGSLINKPDEYGCAGTIYNEGNLTIIDSTIKDNNVYTTPSIRGCGGAIYNKGTSENNAKLTINNSNITNNKILGIYGDGGAIYATYSHVNINNTQINNNLAGNNGAIFVSYSQVNINNTQIHNNNATNENCNGGAIEISESQTYITNTVFTKNIAKGKFDNDGCGGAIYVKGSRSNVTINSSLFINNTANLSSAIYISEYVTAFIHNSTFTNNDVYGEPGSKIDTDNPKIINTLQELLNNPNTNNNTNKTITDLQKELDIAKNQLNTYITSDIQTKAQVQELQKENAALQNQLKEYKIESKPNLKLTTKTIKKSKNNQLKAILKFSGKTIKGKTVTFIFNGKVYKTKTNKNGLAKITIKKSALKKIKGKKTYYYAIYGNKSIKKTIKITK